MADVIAMDSSIPLKKRPVFSAATGEIPKLGMEMTLNETQLTELQMMQSSSIVPESRIVTSLFRDTVSVIRGQYERLEHIFLEGLSRGAAVVAKGPSVSTAAGNVGSEIRLDFQYKTDHQFNSSVSWDDAAAKPFTDLANVVLKADADGQPITKFLLDQTTLNNLLKSDEAKEIYGGYINAITGVAAVPTLSQINAATQDKWGFTFEVIKRTTVYQIDGVDTAVQPWAAGQVVGINNENLGDVVWSMLAEMNAPVAGVTYQVADEFILAAKFRTNRPSLKEFTNSQSRAVPVISAIEQIYHLDTTVDSAT